MSLEFVRVKEEPEWEGSPTKELYAQHEIKHEMVVGPEQLQPPDIAFAVAASKIKTEVECDQREEIVPPRKKRKNTHFTENEKLMILNTFKYVGETWPADKYRSKQAMKDKTAEIVGVSKSAVYRVIKEYTKTDTIQPAVITKRLTMIEKLDEFDKSRIRKAVYSFYLKQELPTAKKLLSVVHADESLSLPHLGLTSLKKILNHLKFKYVKRRRAKNGIIDRDDIALWRINYLEKIKSFRQQGRPVYYLAETWLNAGNTAGKDSVQSQKQALTEGLPAKKTSPNRPQLMLLLIGSEKGFLPQSELVIETRSKDHALTTARLESWFGYILPKLEQHAVVVMNSSFLSRREKTPVTTWKKCDIQQWLKSKTVAFDGDEVKIKLLDKVKAVKGLNQYIVDEKAKEFGVEILRLPPFHCELNPVEIFWADVKGHVARDALNMSEVKQIVQRSLNDAEKWLNCISNVKEDEGNYERLDNEIDKTIDSGETYVLSDASDSSTETEAESDSN